MPSSQPSSFPTLSVSSLAINNITVTGETFLVGGFLIRLSGIGFGSTGASISMVEVFPKIDTRKLHNSIVHECELISQSENLITLIAPTVCVGITTIVLSVNGHSCQKNFNYSAPSITYFAFERGGDAAGGEQLRVYGNNFGSIPTPVRLTFSDGSFVCQSNIESVLGNNSAHIKCITTPTTSGWKIVSIHIAGQESLSARYYLECKTGSYGLVSGYCKYCGNAEQTGQLCPYNGMVLPISAPGWFMINTTVDNDRCLSNFTSHNVCNSLWPCYPSYSCIGNNVCAQSYEGDRCAFCDSRSYKINGTCETCPSEIWPLCILVIVFVSIFAYVIYRVMKRTIYFGNSTIGIDYLQSLGLLSNCKHLWNKPLSEVLNSFSVLNLNFDILALKCWGINPPFLYSWIIKQVLPMSILFLLVFMWYIRNCFSRSREISKSHNSFWILYVMVSYLIYVSITHNSLSIFDCLETSPPDGFSYLTAVGVVRSAICNSPNSLQQRLQPWAIVSFVIYSIGMIASLSLMLYCRHILNYVEYFLKYAFPVPSEHTKQFDKFEIIPSISLSLQSCFESMNENWILILLLRKLTSCSSIVVSKNSIVILTAFWVIHLFSTVLQLYYLPYKRINVLYSPLPSPAPTSPTSSISTLPPSTIEELLLYEERYEFSSDVKPNVIVANNRDRSRQLLRIFINITDPNKAEVICLVSILTIAAAGIIQELNSKYALLQSIMTFVCVVSIIITLTYLLIAVFIELYIDCNFNSIDSSNTSQEDLDSIEDDFEANMKEELKTEDAFYDLFSSPSDDFVYVNPMSINLSSVDEDFCLKSPQSPHKLKERSIVDSQKRKVIDCLEKSLQASNHNRQKPSTMRNCNLYRTKSSDLSLPPATFDVSEITEKMKFKQDMPSKPVMSMSSKMILSLKPFQKKNCEPNQDRKSISDDMKSMIGKQLHSASFYSMSFHDGDDYNEDTPDSDTESITEPMKEHITTDFAIPYQENRSIHELSAIHRKKLETLKTLRKTNYRNTLTQCEPITYDSSQDPIIIMGSSYGDILPK